MATGMYRMQVCASGVCYSVLASPHSKLVRAKDSEVTARLLAPTVHVHARIDCVVVVKLTVQFSQSSFFVCTDFFIARLLAPTV